MQQNIKHYQENIVRYVARFQDVRYTGQVVFVGIVLLISWSGIKAIQANYDLQKQAAALAQQNNVQKLENENFKLQNDYYKSNQYLELSARQNFGLAAPGEKEVLVPRSVALTYATSLPLGLSNAPSPAISVPFYQRNLELWVNYFFHRHTVQS